MHHPTEDAKSAQEGNDRMEQLVNSKGLELNLGKCNNILIGNCKARRKLNKQMEKEKLSICRQPVKEVKLH